MNVRAYTLYRVAVAAKASMARIYVETTIPSFYFDVRSAAEMVARRNWTRRWFDAARQSGDALHLAAASYHRCDFLVTWNCEHLANANKFGHIRRINTMLVIGCPMLITPLELLKEGIDDE